MYAKRSPFYQMELDILLAAGAFGPISSPQFVGERPACPQSLVQKIAEAQVYINDHYTEHLTLLSGGIIHLNFEMSPIFAICSRMRCRSPSSPMSHCGWPHAQKL